MSRVTAAFVCALCDPDNPRPASIMCSNNCGRYVCAVHAVSRKGPGSAMVCQVCAEALGLADKPKPKPVPEVRPLIEVSSEPVTKPAPTPAPEVRPLVEASSEPAPTPAPVQPTPAVAEPAAKVEVVSAAVAINDQPTEAVPPLVRVPDPVVIDQVVPAEQQKTARRIVEPEAPPKSVASETVVSQRGNTLQVPKVTPTLGKPPTPIGPKPRKAQRTGDGVASNLDWTLIGSVAGSVALGIVGLVLVLVAITP